MKKDLYNFHYRGIHVTIHWTFLLVLIWMIIVNLLSGFSIIGWIWSLIILFSLMASISIHDLAQAVVGTICGISINRLIIMPIGGLPSISTPPKKGYYEILMLAAGPVANLSIAALLTIFLHPYMAYWNEPGNIGVAYAGNFIFQLQFINLSLGLLNLLPCFPMDGGRALEVLLEKRLSSGKATQIVNLASILIALGFILNAIVIKKFSLLLVGFFIFFTIRKGRYYHPAEDKSDQLGALT
jgi:Zn-dependent protease